MGGCAVVIVGNYFYQYYNEYDTDGTYRKPGVARALIADVVAAAKTFTVTPWVKYYNGSWSRNALTQAGSSVLPYPSDRYDAHGDAVYCAPLGKYLMVVYEQSGWDYLTFQASDARKGIYLYTSTDGINWGSKQHVFNPLPGGDGCYPFFAGIDGASDDNFVVGNASYLYVHDRARHELYRIPITVSGGTPTVATPTLNPPAGSYSSAQSVAISSATSGASIRYTLDGSTPTSSSGTLYAGPVSVSSSATLKAIAYKSGSTNSAVRSGDYTITIPTVATPTFSPPAGDYPTAQSVAISSATSGANIRYTLDGSTPTSSSGILYAGPVSVSSSATLKAIAYKSGSTNSSVGSASYVIGLATGSLVNGSFEQGTDGWTITSSNGETAACAVLNTQGASHESYALALGSGNVAGNAILTQTVSGNAGASCTLTFDYGAFGASGKVQVLLVEALDGETVLASQQFTANGAGNYLPASTTWAPRSLAWTSAASGVTTIRFKDLTTSANSLNVDGMLDDVALAMSGGTPPPSGGLVNGGFENGTSGWTITPSGGGTAACAVLDTQGAIDPTQSMALGTANAAGNAVVAQTLSTTSGTPFTLTFQYGAFGAAGKQQRLLVEVLNGATPLSSQLVTAYGPGNYLAANTTFQAYSLDFTAGSAATVIRFTDQTTLANSSSCDGMLDAVAVNAVPGGGLPGDWLNGDIGTVGVTGSASESGGVYTVEGAGEDIWGTADAFHFAQQTASGDCEITACVNAIENTDPWAKAGVMIRETLNANSTFAMTVLTPTNGANQMYRTTTGGTCGYTQSTGKAAPYWVRVRRVGNSFTSFISPDGTTWTQVGTARTITMGAGTYIGLCVSSHLNSELNTSIFDSVSVTQ